MSASKKKPTTQTKNPKLKAAQDRIKAEREAYKSQSSSKVEPSPHKGKGAGSSPASGTISHTPSDPKTYSPIIKLMDDGVQKEIDDETKIWNERLFAKAPIKGTSADRFPLSASQGGKCALALARGVAHYLGVADYPRSKEAISPRVQRIFARGHLLEAALIADLAKFTHLKVIDQQRRVRLFTLGGGKRHIEGNIDAVLYNEEDGTRILTDFKSKGAFHSHQFSDSINEQFQELKQTGFVEEIHPNCFLITDAYGLFKIISLDEFFIDYLIQLNAYAFSFDPETGEALNPDFVALYYENKNTCANYEVRWKPDRKLFEFLEKKFNFIYDNVRKVAAEKVDRKLTTEGFDILLEKEVPKEYSLGSPRCKLCDHNELCWGKYDPTLKPAEALTITLPIDTEQDFITALAHEAGANRIKEEILAMMAKADATHFNVNGMTFERKYLKSPKPHYELRLCQKPLRSR